MLQAEDKTVDEACCDVSCLRWFLSFRCGGSRELQTNFDELEGLLVQAASAQTADPVEDAKQAVPPRVLGDVVAGLPCLLWAASERPLGSSPLQIVAFAQEEQQQKTVQEKEEIKEVLRL